MTKTARPDASILSNLDEEDPMFKSHGDHTDDEDALSAARYQ